MQSQHPGKSEGLSGKCMCKRCNFKCHKIGDLRKHLSRNHNVVFEYETVNLSNMTGKSTAKIKSFNQKARWFSPII